MPIFIILTLLQSMKFGSSLASKQSFNGDCRFIVSVVDVSFQFRKVLFLVRFIVYRPVFTRPLVAEGDSDIAGGITSDLSSLIALHLKTPSMVADPSKGAINVRIQDLGFFIANAHQSPAIVIYVLLLLCI